MSTSVGVETLTLIKACGLTCLSQSTCFLWSSTEYTLWKGKGENREVPWTASRSRATLSVFLLPHRCPPNHGWAPGRAPAPPQARRCHKPCRPHTRGPGSRAPVGRGRDG